MQIKHKIFYNPVKLIEALQRQTNIIYIRESCRQAQKEIGIAHELESWKPRNTISRPLYVGIAVYKLVKLQMLVFYYDFLDRYFKGSDFELIQKDTDSNYMAVFGQLEWPAWDSGALLKVLFIEQLQDRKKKLHTKGVSKKQNEITWQRFKTALEGSKDMATDTGFRMRGRRVVNYEQLATNAGSWPTGCTPNQSNFTFSSQRLEVLGV